MPSQPLTLSVLAGLDVDASGSGLTAKDREEATAKLSEEVKKITAKGSAPELSKHLLDFVTESLRKPVAGVLGEVWRQRKEMREAGAKDGDDKSVTGDVELIDHSMKWVLHPSVQLTVDGVAMKPKLVFDVDVDLALAGVKIVIKNACITQVRAGTLTSTVKLACRDIELTKQSKSIDLPGELDLPHGGIDLSGIPR